ncbi:uncharacterized protein DFL_007899 [Arthrobotrys flagrans]|uniref:BTB domain-containing protein n=1 Tax=Arthrobotrys flagrans TaxID=97331 RepID=A0A436ZXS8_ARTFL|nr:hypothetical protein DFL_007899 [Arthrobotrys flagrans]
MAKKNRRRDLGRINKTDDIGIESREEVPAPPKINLLSVLPFFYEYIPSRTPSQSEADDNSIIAEETTTNASLHGPSSPLKPATDTHHIDRDGDSNEADSDSVITTLTEDYNLTVIVKDKSDGKIFKFRVSKDVLSISSPVLKSLIGVNIPPQGTSSCDDDSDRKAGEPVKTGQTLFLEGHPSAFHAILSIVHFALDKKALLSIGFETFTEIALLVEKYEWGRAIQPWSDIWLKKFERYALRPGYENWLYIAKVFDTTKNVERLIALLGRQCASYNGACFSRRYKTHGRLSGDFWNHQVVKTDLWPNGIKNRIMVSRARRIEDLTSSLLTLVQALGSTGNSRYDEFLCSSGLCRGLAYGSLLRSLHANGLGLSTLSENAALWTGSAAELQEKGPQDVSMITEWCERH